MEMVIPLQKNIPGSVMTIFIFVFTTINLTFHSHSILDIVGSLHSSNNLRLSKHNDTTIHWKALEEHFLMVPLVRSNHSRGENAFSEFFSKNLIVPKEIHHRNLNKLHEPFSAQAIALRTLPSLGTNLEPEEPRYICSLLQLTKAISLKPEPIPRAEWSILCTA
jgi:hypothetical protein